MAREPVRVSVSTARARDQGQDPCGGQVFEEPLGSRAVGHLTSCEQEGDGTALVVRQRVDLGRASTPRTPDRLVLLPPLPPDAERCAFTAVESIST